MRIEHEDDLMILIDVGLKMVIIGITRMISLTIGWVLMMMVMMKMMMRRWMIGITRMMGLISGWVRKPMGSLRGEGTC